MFVGESVTVERVNCWLGVCERCVVKRLRQGAVVAEVRSVDIRSRLILEGRLPEISCLRDWSLLVDGLVTFDVGMSDGEAADTVF